MAPDSRPFIFILMSFNVDSDVICEKAIKPAWRGLNEENGHETAKNITVV
jgi:hypothetical protein